MSDVASRNFILKRIRYLTAGRQTGRIRRTFRQPHEMVAVEETAAWAEHASEPGQNGVLLVAIISGRPASWEKEAEDFLAHSVEPTSPTVVVSRKNQSIMWRPGRAVINAPANNADDLLDAVIEVDFHAAELHKLEAALARTTQEAEQDVKLAFRVLKKDRQDWPRLSERLETYALMRLNFARLAPQLTSANPGLNVEARRWTTKLFEKASLEDRAEAVSDILETREDLYEGAVDRITDYFGWRHGYLLEILIILLLLVEIVFMGIELYLHMEEMGE